MRAGKMKRRVTIQEFVSFQNPETGSIVKEWRDVATVWGEISSVSGRELIAAQAEQAEMIVRIWIRYRKGVTTKNRLTCTEEGMPATVYDIKAVLPDSDRTRLEIMCTGGLTSG
ncbi:phage head closure protein [Citrobacter koseri]|uniref:phage head closure protein n=1 Tax=Citrobacter koseri TaxID=545 RepID=UPI003CFB9A01